MILIIIYLIIELNIEMGNSEATHYSPETHAYRVVAVLAGSPAEDVGIEA